MKKLLFILLLANTALSQTYVNQAATGSNNGTSWTNAYTDLQDALTNAQANDVIWVAAGTYKPTTTTNRDISFVIPDSVKVYGGFAGNEPASFDLHLRNFEANETILSGNIGSSGSFADNSFHVVRTNYVSPETLISGFTISDGNADDGMIGIPEVLGGGFFNNADGTGNESNPTVMNCIFKNNYAISGGGFYNFGNGGVAKSTIINCQFISNSARSGGGILNNARIGGEATATVINTVFYDNSAAWDGGGVMNFSRGNSPNHSKYINCTFVNNTAGLDGDDMFNEEQDSGDTDIQIANSIFYYTPTSIPIEREGNIKLNISYSLVNGPSCSSLGLGPFGCEFSDGMVFDSNFEFVDKENGDFRTSYTSSARNAGLGLLNTTPHDILGRARILNDTIDIGAYEGINELFVNVNSTLTQNGTSWDNGFKGLQRALKEAKKVWVASGIYYPTQDNDRFASFELKEGMELYGGFAGTEDVETYDLTLRNLTLNETILSANINDLSDSTDNSYRILNMRSSNLEQAKVDGFTFSGSQADRTPYALTGVGGAILAIGSSQILNCTFKNNYAFLQGGAILASPSNGLNLPIIDNCTFSNNSSSRGSAIYCEQSTSPKIRKSTFIANKGAISSSLGTIYIQASSTSGMEVDQCHFENNTARSGMAISISSSRGVSDHSITNSTFVQNTASSSSSSGGAIYVSSSSGANLGVSILNSVFDRNMARNGGAIYSIAGSKSIAKLKIGNSLFVSNEASSEGGALLNSELSTGLLIVDLTNSIFWENKENGFLNSWSNHGNPELTLSHSLVQDANCSSLPNTTCTGGNIFNQSPQFIDFSNNNYRLDPSSSAVNAGVNDSVTVITDLASASRIKGGTVDMGPYETAGLMFVNQAATTGAMNGSSWTDAFLDLQDALQLAVPRDTIWVGKGTYKPTNDGNRDVSYIIKDSVKVFGGLAGNEPTSYDLNQRNFKNNETILSGNIGDVATDNDNTLRIVTMRNVSKETVINGFTLTKAQASALYNDGSNYGKSSPSIKNCVFIDNFGGGFGIAGGAGIYNDATEYGLTSPLIANCYFIENEASDMGGAILNLTENNGTTKPEIRNCIFSQNRAYWNAGAICNYSPSLGKISLLISNCTFYNNYITGPGDSKHILTLNNSLNKDTIYVRNSIFWNEFNTSSEFLGTAHYYFENCLLGVDSCGALLTTSTKSVNCASNMVYNQDPLFVDVTTSNFKLKQNSPAIDIGTKAIGFIADITGQPHINLPDAGAHEYPCSQILDINSVPNITNEYNSQAAIQTLQAANLINPTSNVYYQAGKHILLYPGFEAKSGNVFEAVIDDGCN